MKNNVKTVYKNMQTKCNQLQDRMIDFTQYYVADQFNDELVAYHEDRVSLSDLTNFLNTRKELVKEYDKVGYDSNKIDINCALYLYKKMPYLFDYTETASNGHDKIRRNYGLEYVNIKNDLYSLKSYITNHK